VAVQRNPGIPAVDDDPSVDLTGDWVSRSLSDVTAEGDVTASDVTASDVTASDHTAEGDDTASDDWERVVIGSGPSARTSSSTSTSSMSAPTKGAPTAKNTSTAKNTATAKNAPTAKNPPTTKNSAVEAVPTAVESRRARRSVERQMRREAVRRSPFWRGRVIPKTVLGISFTMLVAGLAMAVSGTLLFMQYRFRQDESDALVRNFPAQVRLGQRAVQNEGNNARALIQQDLAPLQKLAATSKTLNDVVTAAGPSVWAVRTRDVDGQGVGGSAFVVASDDQKAFLLTSLAVVRASTAKPGPEIKVRKGDNEVAATLWTWDEAKDLALLVINTGNLPPLSWAAPGTAALGDQVFAVSGFGGSGAAILEGRVADPSADGLQHSAPIGSLFRGGPLLNTDGRVVAIASRDFTPIGIPAEGFATPVQSACGTVLRCSGNRVEGAGAQR
jgi:S1-C subfamily serine protease